MKQKMHFPRICSSMAAEVRVVGTEEQFGDLRMEATQLENLQIEDSQMGNPGEEDSQMGNPGEEQAGTICGTFVQRKSGLKIFVLFVFTFRDKL